MPVLRASTTPSSSEILQGPAWKAATAASKGRPLTVPALIRRPRMGSRAMATLRVDSPSTKQARIMRSIVGAHHRERAHARDAELDFLGSLVVGRPHYAGSSGTRAVNS